MSTLSVSSITGVTNVTGSIFDTMGTTANNANATAIAAFAEANSAETIAISAFGVANTANTTAASAGVVTGGIIYYPSATAPSGFLLADGNVYTRSAYGNLANVMGTPPQISSWTLEYSNTRNNTFSAGGSIRGMFMLSANNLLVTHWFSNYYTGNTQNSGALYTSLDGSTWTSRTAASISVSFGTGPTYTNYIPNGAIFTSNGKSGVYLLHTSADFSTGVSGTDAFYRYQTSADEGATWTNRSFRPVNPSVSGGNPYSAAWLNGYAAGGTSNAYVLLQTLVYYNSTAGCCGTATTPWGVSANVMWSADGITWTAGTTLVSNTSASTVPTSILYKPALGSTLANGFVVVMTTNENRSNNSGQIFWSANGRNNWTDVTANVIATLGGYSGLNSSPTFYNVFSCNNQIIIPCSGNRFLVTSNGANGTWSVVNYSGGLPFDPGSIYAESGSESSEMMSFFRGDVSSRIDSSFSSTIFQTNMVHNGQVFLCAPTWSGSSTIVASSDLKTWWSVNDRTLGMGNFKNAPWVPNIAATRTGKIVLANPQIAAVVSFTTNGTYTAATQFPVPKLTTGLQTSRIAYNTVITPMLPYIKT